MGESSKNFDIIIQNFVVLWKGLSVSINIPSDLSVRWKLKAKLELTSDSFRGTFISEDLMVDRAYGVPTDVAVFDVVCEPVE